MDLTSKQRAQLRGMANGLDVIVTVGKDGIGENLVKQADDALEARELIKCRVLENSLYSAREACTELAKLTRSEEVQVIGSKVWSCTGPVIKRARRTRLFWSRTKRREHERMKIGIFGGTFNPPHLGTMAAATAAIDTLI